MGGVDRVVGRVAYGIVGDRDWGRVLKLGNKAFGSKEVSAPHIKTYFGKRGLNKIIMTVSYLLQINQV